MSARRFGDRAASFVAGSGLDSVPRSRPIRGSMKSWLSALAVNLERRPIIVAFLGFSSGLPFLLVFGTLTTWLARDGVSKAMIGLFALVGSAYALKFWWSPLVDRLPLPPFTTLLGRRRGWIVFSQLVLIVVMLALGST